MNAGGPSIGTWKSWTQIDTVVSKNLTGMAINVNGYIKYASGLLMQWVSLFNSETFSSEYKDIPWPISFSSAHGYCTVVSTSSTNRTSDTYSIQNANSNAASIRVFPSPSTNYLKCSLFSIGY